MPISGDFSTAGDRVTQAGDQRVIENGDQRIIQQPNAGAGTLTVDATRTAFVGPENVNYLGTWYEPATSVNYLGSWVTPSKGYYFDNGMWKRIL
jgi:hypothetical protein